MHECAKFLGEPVLSLERVRSSYIIGVTYGSRGRYSRYFAAGTSREYWGPEMNCFGS